MSWWLSLVLSTVVQTGTPAVQIVSREAMSRIDEPRQAVARTASEWASLWRQHAGDTVAPAVDFGSRTVVAVFLGSRSSAGYTVDVTAVREANGTLIVTWRERRPPPGAVSAQVLTSPAIIVSIPKFAGTITFEKVER